MTKKRKAKYGLKKGVDIIVRSDESFKIGELTVSMQEIQDKIRLKKRRYHRKKYKTWQNNTRVRYGGIRDIRCASRRQLVGHSL